MASPARKTWHQSALLGLAAFTTAAGCAAENTPAVPAPAPPPLVVLPQPSQNNTLLPPPPVVPTMTLPSLMFLQALPGTMLLKEDRAPVPIGSYGARQYRSSSLAGRGILEAWEETAGDGGSRVVAMLLDPASGSAQTVPVESPGRRDSMPAVAGTSQGHALMVWASRSNDGSETLVVGQTLAVGGGSGPRWSYRRGAGEVLGTAAAPGKDSYVALWIDRRAGGGLGSSSAAGALSQAMLMSQRISMAGEAVGTAQMVGGTQGVPSQPALAWSGDNYLAVWVDTRESGSRLFARVLDNSGQGLSSEILITDSPHVENPSVAWDGQRYQVTWADGRAGLAGGRDYFVQAIGKAGSLDNSNVVVSQYHMVGPAPRSRVVPSGTGAIAVFSGQAVDPDNARAAAPSTIFASLLVPGATPSAPFAIRGIEGVRLVDAQPWGNGMVVLSEREGPGHLSLEWSYYTAPAGNPRFGGAGGFGSFNRPYYRDPFSQNRPMK